MAARCPTCGKPVVQREPQVAPFCSARCKTIDLGRWLKGDYAIPTAETDDGDGDRPDPAPSEGDD